MTRHPFRCVPVNETVIRSEERQCKGKKGIATAKQALRRAQQKERELGEKINFYHCHYCKLFHIGHPIGFQYEELERMEAENFLETLKKHS